MTAFLVKACTNCGGDVHRLDEIDGEEWRCLQCGRALDVRAAVALLAERKAA